MYGTVKFYRTEVFTEKRVGYLFDFLHLTALGQDRICGLKRISGLRDMAWGWECTGIGEKRWVGAGKNPRYVGIVRDQFQ